VSDPREGLPPCLVGFAEFEGRRASMHQKSLCTFSCNQPADFLSTSGRILERIEDHPHSNWLTGNLRGVVNTDDPAEAQAAYERGAEWVLTGEGP
jgi:hypothetical protein